MDRTTIDQLIAEAGLKKHAKSIWKVIRPCAFMRHASRSGDAVPVGAAKLGGAPDARDGFQLPWPVDSDDGTALQFVAQIPLALAKAAQPELRLPDSGFLYLFYSEGSEQVAYYDAEATSENVNRLPEINEAERGFEATTPMEIELKGGFMVPDNPPEFVFEKDIMMEYLDLSEKIGAGDGSEEDEAPRHWLGGVPISFQGNEFEEYKSFIAQIDSDEKVGWSWGDLGRVFYLDLKGETASGKFKRVEVQYESH